MVFLEEILKYLGIEAEKVLGGKVLEKMDLPTPHPFLEDFKVLWADSGDNISNVYAGTDATTSNMTKNGQSNFLDKITHKVNGTMVGLKRLVTA